MCIEEKIKLTKKHSSVDNTNSVNTNTISINGKGRDKNKTAPSVNNANAIKVLLVNTLKLEFYCGRVVF